VRLRRERDRPDPHELAAERLSDGLGPYEPLPPQLERYDRKRLLLLVVLGGITVAVLRDGLGRGAPPVAGSCTKPAFSFDRDRIRVDLALKWAVAGPSGSSVIVTADSTSADEGRLLGPVELRGCKADGLFGVPLSDGTHVLRVFLRAPDGTTALLGQQDLEVDVPR
jgi:hypothetical protein